MATWLVCAGVSAWKHGAPSQRIRRLARGKNCTESPSARRLAFMDFSVFLGRRRRWRGRLRLLLTKRRDCATYSRFDLINGATISRHFVDGELSRDPALTGFAKRSDSGLATYSKCDGRDCMPQGPKYSGDSIAHKGCIVLPQRTGDKCHERLADALSRSLNAGFRSLTDGMNSHRKRRRWAGCSRPAQGRLRPNHRCLFG